MMAAMDEYENRAKRPKTTAESPAAAVAAGAVAGAATAAHTSALMDIDAAVAAAGDGAAPAVASIGVGESMPIGASIPA